MLNQADMLVTILADEPATKDADDARKHSLVGIYIT